MDILRNLCEGVQWCFLRWHLSQCLLHCVPCGYWGPELKTNLYQVVQSILCCDLLLVGHQIKHSSCEPLNFWWYEYLLLEKLNNPFTEITEGDSFREFWQIIIKIQSMWRRPGRQKMYECGGSSSSQSFTCLWNALSVARCRPVNVDTPEIKSLWLCTSNPSSVSVFFLGKKKVEMLLWGPGILLVLHCSMPRFYCRLRVTLELPKAD